MKTKFFLAVLAASVLAFFGGWLIFGIIFNEYYSSNTNEAAKLLMKSPTNMWAVAVSNIAWALLITWVLQKTGSTNMMKGFRTSLWVSFLVVLVFNLSMYAFWNIYELPFLIADSVISSIFWGIVGSASGAILGSGQKIMTKVTS